MAGVDSASLMVSTKAKDVVEQGVGNLDMVLPFGSSAFGVLESRQRLWHHDPLESHCV